MNALSVCRIFGQNRANIFLKVIADRSRRTFLAKMSTSASISELQRDKESFQDLFPKLCESLATRSKLSEIPEVAEWCTKVLEYNLSGGKLMRGLATTFAYETLASPEDFTEENLKISRILGWCTELLHAYFLVLDDIMDGSSKRRGLTCWYRVPEVGIGAINDAILIYATIFEILRTHCSHLPQYRQIVELFNESLLYTTMGQHLDISMAHRNKDDYSLFTIERYNSIVQYKTAYYTCKLPVFLGMRLVNVTEPATYQIAEEVCLQIGHMFQMQDDYIDCYGQERVTGKVGTDIQERKCSWLAVQALNRMTSAQRSVFATCYGSAQPAHVDRIKRIYDELDLPAIYRQEERHRYDLVMQRLQQLPANAQELFIKLVNMINERKN